MIGAVPRLTDPPQELSDSVLNTEGTSIGEKEGRRCLKATPIRFSSADRRLCGAGSLPAPGITTQGQSTLKPHPGILELGIRGAWCWLTASLKRVCAPMALDPGRNCTIPAAARRVGNRLELEARALILPAS